MSGLHKIAKRLTILVSILTMMGHAQAQTNLALGKTCVASSTQAGGILTLPKATDGDLATRWGSNWTDDQWIYVDLGESKTIGRVVLRWEAAYGSGYKIQVSDNTTSWTDLTTVTNGNGGVDDLAVTGTGRYVRMLGMTRGSVYGYSLYEFEVYTDPPIDGPPFQTENQTINLTFPVQGLAYAKVNVSPTPLSVTPMPDEGATTPSVRNPTMPETFQMTFPPNTNVTISKNQFSGSNPNTDIVLSTVDYNAVPQTGTAVTTLAMNGAVWNVVVRNTGGGGGNNHPPANWIADPYVKPAGQPVEDAFDLVAPVGSAMVTGTRRPVLSWQGFAGATGYDVYLNISRTDYDWAAPGNLLDRYTMVGTVGAATSFTVPQDLADRWTYKWYVVAKNGASTLAQSDVGTFSLYKPVITAVNDGVAVIGGCRDLNKNGTIEPYEDWHNPPAVRTADLLARMSLHEKAMQLFFNTQKYPLAGFGFGPFSLSDLLGYQKLANQTNMGIPMISMGDTIHGYKTVFPTQPGLAATRDMRTAWEVADVQRRESLAVGHRGTLSPLAEVGTKVLYPRIQEGCGEDADLAAAMVRAMVVGLQGGPEVSPDSMMITTKHWSSQGAGGEAGMVYDGTTIWYHMRPWHAALEAGTSSIMPGYGGSWLLGTAGLGASDDPGILGFLRNNMGYQGVICTDWLPSGSWARACINGADVMGGADPAAMENFENEVPLSRINDAVTRVLDLKFRMGIFEDPYGANTAGSAQWQTGEKVAKVKNAAVKSLTLLKNNGPLPLRVPTGGSIVVDGPRADDPSCMVTWRSDFHETEFGMKTIYRALVARAAQEGVTVYGPRARGGTPVPSGVTPAAAIVVVGESYFTHGTDWNKDSPYLPDDPIGPEHDMDDAPQYSLIQQYKAQGIPVIVVCILPRPYVLTNVAAQADALMVVYRPGDLGGVAIAETLFGDHSPVGKTPWQLPKALSQIGVDIQAQYQNQPDKWDLPYDMGATPAELAEIRAKIAAGEHVEPIYGDPLYQYGSGIQGFGLVDSTPPQAFNLLTPADGQNITGALPAFTWEASADAETGIQKYEVFIDGNLATTLKKGTSYTLSGVTLGNGTHTWQVRATNWAGGTTTTGLAGFTINDTTPPAAFLSLLPANNATVNDPSNLTFHWEQSADGGTGIASYQLLIDGNVAATVVPTDTVPVSTNLAQGKTAYGSSTEQGPPGAGVDGNMATRWSSAWTNIPNPDAEWYTVDLGAVYSIKRVVIKWEAAYGKQYLIQVSTDNAAWKTIYTESAGNGSTDDLTGLAGAGRYVRMQGVKRQLNYGYSLWEFEVYGKGAEQATVSLAPGVTHTWQVRATDGAGNTTLNSNGLSTIVPGLTPLQAWRQQNFGTTSAGDPVGGNLAAPRGDGVANLVKYALGLNPAVPATTGLPVGTRGTTYFNLTFTRLRDATDITYRVEATDNLGGWTEIWNSSAHPYEGIAISTPVTVQDTVPMTSANPGRFLRLKVTTP